MELKERLEVLKQEKSELEQRVKSAEETARQAAAIFAGLHRKREALDREIVLLSQGQLVLELEH